MITLFLTFWTQANVGSFILEFINGVDEGLVLVWGQCILTGLYG